MSRASSKTTTDHEAIRRWAEERDGRPAAVRATFFKLINRDN